MELKHFYNLDVIISVGLLIVPYGIETVYSHEYISRCAGLLIVPYGIETISMSVGAAVI